MAVAITTMTPAGELKPAQEAAATVTVTVTAIATVVTVAAMYNSKFVYF
jgi:hypothetical protein